MSRSKNGTVGVLLLVTLLLQAFACILPDVSADLSAPDRTDPAGARPTSPTNPAAQPGVTPPSSPVDAAIDLGRDAGRTVMTAPTVMMAAVPAAGAPASAGSGACDAGSSMGSRCTQPEGEACNSDSQCASGACRRKRCCGVNCDLCKTCDPTDGACVGVAFGDNAPSCMGTRTCSSRECLDVDASNGISARQTEATITSGKWIAQTFEVVKGGTLAEIRVSTDCPRILASLSALAADGSPKDHLEAIIVDESSDTDYRTALRIGREREVKSGDRLALTLGLAFPGSDGNTQTCVVGATQDDNYPAGHMYALDTNTQVWQTTDASKDLTFKLIVAR